MKEERMITMLLTAELGKAMEKLDNKFQKELMDPKVELFSKKGAKALGKINALAMVDTLIIGFAVLGAVSYPKMLKEQRIKNRNLKG